MYEKSLDLVALGEGLIEFNQQSRELYQFGFGGDTSNCLIAAARSGARCAYLTQLGDDMFGDALLQLWQREDIDVTGVGRQSTAPTGLYFVTHGPHGHKFSYRRTGSAASQITPSGLAPGLIERSHWLHVSGISQAVSEGAAQTVRAAIKRAQAAGTLISYDLNFRPALATAQHALDLARQVLSHCRIFLCSSDEIQALVGLENPQEILRWAHDQGAQVVVLKLGAEGSLISSADGVECIPPHKVKAIDATGAGDCYAGVLLAKLAQGNSLGESARAASIGAALSTLGYGAVEPLPYWVDIENHLDHSVI